MGLSSELTTEAAKTGTPPRITLMVGCLLQAPFYSFLILTVFSCQSPNPETYQAQCTDIPTNILLLASGALLGYGQQAVTYGIKKYVYQCHWKEDKSRKYVRRVENLVPFAGMLGMTWSGCYFWFGILGQEVTLPQLFNDYAYYQIITLVAALVITLVLPAAPYSELKNVNRRVKVESCFSKSGRLLKKLFSFRLLLSFLLVACTSSFTAIYETIIFAFLAFNTEDKTNSPPLGLPFMVLILYHGTMFIFGTG